MLASEFEGFHIPGDTDSFVPVVISSASAKTSLDPIPPTHVMKIIWKS